MEDICKGMEYKYRHLQYTGHQMPSAGVDGMVEGTYQWIDVCF